MVRVVKEIFDGRELWRCRGQFYIAHIFSDDIVQVFTSTREGRQVGTTPLLGHNTENREQAMKHLSEFTRDS